MKQQLLDIRGRPLPPTAFIIRHTELAQFLSCPRKWAVLSHNGLNMRPKTKNRNLRLGTIWHEALEEYYLMKKIGPVKDAIEAGRVKLEKAIKEDKDSLMESFQMTGMFTESSELDDDAELLRQMYQGYTFWANHEAIVKDVHFDVIDVERRLLVPIYTPKGKKARAMYLAVKIDAIIDYKGGMWVMEHKTAGRSTKVDDVPGLALDLQLALQAMALQHYTHRMRGIFYNVARKQAPSSRVKAPLFGRTLVQKNMAEMQNVQELLYNAGLEMRRISNQLKKSKDPVAELRNIRHIPNVIGNGPCIWGCPALALCEALNRKDDFHYLFESGFEDRGDFMQTLFEETTE